MNSSPPNGSGWNPEPFWQSLMEDFEAHVPPEARDVGAWTRVRRDCRTLLLSSGLHLVMLYRTAHSARRRGWLGRLAAAICYWLGRRLYGCSISPKARMMGGLILPHPHNIVIGADVTVGPRAWIFQGVTLGADGRDAGMPTIGADARIMTGAVVVGPIHLGDGVTVGANAVVRMDLPSRSIAMPPEPSIVLKRQRQGAVAT